MRNWVLRGSYCKVHMKIAQRLSEACRYLVLFNCVDKLDNCLLQWDAALGYLQLITPMMACEMKCLNDKNMRSAQYGSPEAQECREYCIHHAVRESRSTRIV
ncbi:uncharacterized protein LOC111134498 isoform X2 [Crassostrea virginica]